VLRLAVQSRLAHRTNHAHSTRSIGALLLACEPTLLTRAGRGLCVWQQWVFRCSYEDALRRIKEATGVVDVNEVIQKFLTQDETHNNLVAVRPHPPLCTGWTAATVHR
jgi:hypothetical protein